MNHDGNINNVQDVFNSEQHKHTVQIDYTARANETNSRTESHEVSILAPQSSIDTLPSFPAHKATPLSSPPSHMTPTRDEVDCIDAGAKWQKSCLLVEKGFFNYSSYKGQNMLKDVVLTYYVYKKQFEAKYWHKRHIKDRTVFQDIYYPVNSSICTSFEFIPVKISYYAMYPAFNNQFELIPFQACAHNQHQSPSHYTKRILQLIDSNGYVALMAELYNIEFLMAEFHKYILKERPDSINKIQKQGMEDVEYQYHIMTYCTRMFGAPGCCRQCAALITPSLITICTKIASKKYLYMPHSLAHSVDILCLLCYWLGHVLRHQYITKYLKQNHNLMPMILSVLLRLMNGSHILYESKPKIYHNRRNIIVVSISVLLKQIIIHYRYIKKYYQKKDVGKARLCEFYHIKMIEWMMKELQIVSDVVMIEDDNKKLRCDSDTFLNSLNTDYFGQIVIFTSLIISKHSMMELRHVTTCTQKIGLIWHRLWRLIHTVTHHPTNMRNFFKESIPIPRDLKQNVSSCHWEKCNKTEVSKYHLCSGCRIATYCSKKCQKQDWKRNRHKLICQTYTRLYYFL
eukprot:125709_1